MNHIRKSGFLQHQWCLEVLVTAKGKAQDTVQLILQPGAWRWRTTAVPQPLLQYPSQGRGQDPSAGWCLLWAAVLWTPKSRAITSETNPNGYSWVPGGQADTSPIPRACSQSNFCINIHRVSLALCSRTATFWHPAQEGCVFPFLIQHNSLSLKQKLKSSCY